ncbi:putative pectinesterase/pectinesterase inhibitor 38, partial [Rhododendron vialii]|uniref:putative pectinesterase/pectinesterase inhibitor 38 n=1 Tax=Rhododendron vialii TaxID=182163 RepID=UPI00265E93B4
FVHLIVVNSIVIVPSSSTTYNVTVAKDGSGHFRTISEAVLGAPTNGNNAYFINIKPGVYEEYVSIPEEKPFLALIGSGADKTKITGNRSDRNGFGIKESATLECPILMLCFADVMGEHFILQDITVENSTGPGTQAVALFCRADKAIFYKCKITGYQDTLFADKTRQFYRECDIYGTVDFIFGDARAIFQNCNLFARDTGAVFTAHSRDM